MCISTSLALLTVLLLGATAAKRGREEAAAEARIEDALYEYVKVTDPGQFRDRMSSFAYDYSREVLRLEDISLEAVSEVAEVVYPSLVRAFLRNLFKEVLHEEEEENVARYLHDIEGDVAVVFAPVLLDGLQRHLTNNIIIINNNNNEKKDADTVEDPAGASAVDTLEQAMTRLNGFLSDTLDAFDNHFSETVLEATTEDQDNELKYLSEFEDVLAARDGAAKTNGVMWANPVFLLGLLVGHLLTLALILPLISLG